MTLLTEIVLSHLPTKRKQTPSGWISFNAPCCHNNGHSRDTRGRGGLIINQDGGISYHCFNCGFKTSWQAGRNFSYKMKKLLQWLNVSDDLITKISFEILRLKENIPVDYIVNLPKFDDVRLPLNSLKIAELTKQNKNSIAVLEYIAKRNLYLEDIDYYWSNTLGYRDRLIIPFYFENRIVGWTARSVTNNKPKYMTESQPGFVFGLDWQTDDRNFIVVCEGPIDAIHIEACALLGNEINEQQSILINKMNKNVIVVPDRDFAGKKLVEQAIEQGWQVSMPEWNKDIKDISDAVDKYGRVFTLYSIVKFALSNPLKIKLGAKKWFGT